MSEPKPWMHPKYDVMNMADDDIVLASVAKLYKSEMRLAVAEVERLRAEVEKLRKGDERDMTAAYLYAAEQSKDEIKRLKDEVNLIRGDASELLKGIYSLALNVGQLKDKVERLTKAGDAMAKEWVDRESLYHGNEDFIEAWHAAKSDNLNQPD